MQFITRFVEDAFKDPEKHDTDHTKAKKFLPKREGYGIQLVIKKSKMTMHPK